MKDSTSSFLFGLLAGAALGVAAGILLAPEKGSVTREKLKRKVRDLSEDIHDHLEEMAGDIDPFFAEDAPRKTTAAKNRSNDAAGRASRKPGPKPGPSPEPKTD
jgi:gas vesicle protein